MRGWILFVGVTFLYGSGAVHASTLPEAELQHVRGALPCVLEFVLKNRWKKLDPGIPLPRLIYSHEISLEEYNRRLGVRYSAVVNAFDVTENTIYLDSKGSTYGRFGKMLIDSLAHELTHYVQYFYQKLTEEDSKSDPAEASAVYVQDLFRKAYNEEGLCRN